MNRRRNFLKRLTSAGAGIHGAGKAVLAGGAAAALLAGNVVRGVLGSFSAAGRSFIKKEEPEKKGVVEMKKSTLVGIVVALAAVAGALAALYLYLLRREKELEEYEQLLFSQDEEADNTDYTDFDLQEEAAEADAQAGM